MATTQLQRQATAAGTLHVLTLPPVPKIAAWLKANRGNDKTLVQFGEWYDKQMEDWRRKSETGLLNNFNTLRLLSGAVADGSLTLDQVRALIAEALKNFNPTLPGNLVTEEELLLILSQLPGPRTFVHTQAVASAEWTVNHRLNRFPSAFVVDTAGNWFISEIAYADGNTLVIRHSAPFAGKAYLN